MTVISRPNFDATIGEQEIPERVGRIFRRGAGEHPEAVAVNEEKAAVAAASRLPFLEWARQIPTAKGNMLDFHRFPYQPEIYEAFGDPEVEDADAMKSTQVGLSELMTRLALYLSDQLGATSLYVFPALKQMWEFSSTRVDPLREGSPYLQSRSQLAPRWAWNKGLKRIGSLTKSGFIHYRGSESKNELIAVDADAVFLDEYDSLAPQNVPEAERRIGGSTIGVIRRVGVPSHPEFGIAKRYDTSDKRSWQVKCGHCNEWQPLVFHKNIKWDEDEGGAIVDPRVVCWRCEEPLDVLSGQWVAEYPGRARPGFHVHRLMVPGERNLRNVIEASKLRLPNQVKSFWNNDLGLPYTDATGGLDRAVIAAAISMAETWHTSPMYQSGTPGYRGANFVTMGVDVASARALNVRISEHVDPLTTEGHRKRALHIGTCDSFDEVVELMERYQVTCCVIDHLPEMRLALGVAERFPGRVYVCRYNTGGKQIDPQDVDTEERTVRVLRVPLMDAVAAVMRSLRNLLPEDLPDDYVDNMLAPRREIKKDEYDRTTVIWESKGPDDYYQAEAYDLVATEVLKVRLEVEAANQPEMHALDEMLEFRRSGVADQDNVEYRPGPGDEGGTWGDDGMTYRPGPGE